jgi:uncharacterized membrane protein YeiB
MRWPRTLWPLAATGSMAFTLYVAHIIVIDLVGNEMMWDPSNVAMCVLVAGLIAFACLWKWRLGQGPLERLMSTASTRVADSVERAQVATAR